MRIKTKTTPKKASPKKSRARKSDSIRKKKVAVKPKAEDRIPGSGDIILIFRKPLRSRSSLS
jgi:hypothetical protein